MKKQPAYFETILRTSGFKATPGRVALLNVLKQAGRAVSVPKIIHRLGSSLNQVTIYRALEALVDMGIVRRVDFHHPHAHYELVEGDKHHHHVICKQCGKVEDITGCESGHIESAATRRSRQFNKIMSHSLEFFGICNSCSKKRHV